MIEFKFAADWRHEDRVFSKLYSANVNQVIDYLKSCNFEQVVGNYKKTYDGVTIPRVSAVLSVREVDEDALRRLIDYVNSNFNWEISNFSAFGKIFTKKNLPDLVDSLISAIRNFRAFHTMLNLEFLPKYYDKKLGSNPIIELRYLYHVTEYSSAQRILKQGLIPTDKSRTEFIHPKCSHLLRYLGGLVKLSKDITKLEVHPGLRIKNPVLLKIGSLDSLNKYYFFIDPFSPIDGVVTPNIIPSNLIELVDPKDYANEFLQASLNHSTKLLETKHFSDYHFVGPLDDPDEHLNADQIVFK